jgi:WD40 repeat protein
LPLSGPYSQLQSSQLIEATSHDGTVCGLRFTPDGQQLLSTGNDERLRCWCARTGAKSFTHYLGTKGRSKRGVQMAVVQPGSARNAVGLSTYS